MYFKVLGSVFFTFIIISSGSCSLLQQAVKEPEINVESFRLGKVSPQSIELLPRVAITNLNKFALPLDKLGYKLTLNGRHIFDGQLNKIGSLKPNKAKSVDIPIRLSNETFDFFVNSLLKNKKINYGIEGVAGVKGFSLPFNKNGAVFVPEVKIGKVDFSNISLENISASIPLQIVNKNDFALPFKGLQYSVGSGKKSLFSNSIKQSNISKSGVTNLNIPFNINPSDLVTSSLQLLQNPNFKLDVKAVADFGFTKLPFNTSALLKIRK